MTIHPTAIIEPGAELGSDVTIGPFAVIGRETRIGDGCIIGPHVVIFRFATLGPGCRVHAGAVLGDVPQDLAFKDGTTSYLRIGADCTIREGVTIHRGTKPDTATVVGDRCFLMANSHLGHNVQLGNGVLLANGALLGGYVEVGDRAFISGNAAIHQFTRIGRLVMVSGVSALSKDVPPFCTVPSVTRNRVAGMNIIGMRRAQMSPAERAEVKVAFKLLYRSGLNTSDAVAKILEQFPSGPAREFGEFVAASKRGICRYEDVGEDAADV
jgi:UDP-N-acetylglucosamine acyltransferase